MAGCFPDKCNKGRCSRCGNSAKLAASSDPFEKRIGWLWCYKYDNFCKRVAWNCSKGQR